MNRKLLFFDIDGTLLPDRPQPVPESAVRALHQAQEKGHLFFVNTGRTPYAMPQEIKDLEPDGYICGCGTTLYFHGELLLTSHIPHKPCLAIIEKARECNVSACFEGKDMIYFDGDIPLFPQKLENIRQYLSGCFLSSLSDTQWNTLVYDKLFTYLGGNPRKEEFLDFCRQFCFPIDRGGGEWEIIQKEHSKATGMQFFMDRFGVAKKDCFAFGDSTNDLPMLEAAGNSVAMGNSSPEILPYCSYQTADILEDGILHALEHFQLI